MLAMNGLPDSWWYLSYLVVAVAWTVIWWLVHRGKDVHEPPSGYIIIAFIGMIVGLVWTYWVSGVLIDILTMVGIITKLSSTYLALTIIAVGNALPDALMTITMAKNGKAILGITGSYAG
jgi:Ca2+/Na+ antiporter